MNRSKLRDAFVHHRGLLVKGYGEFSIVIGLWNSTVLLWLVLSTIFDVPKEKAWLAFLAIPIVMVFLYLYGWLYYKKGFFESEQRWYSVNNKAYWDMIQEIRKSGEKK
jgi:fumarate reductase subunit C